VQRGGGSVAAKTVNQTRQPPCELRAENAPVLCSIARVDDVIEVGGMSASHAPDKCATATVSALDFDWQSVDHNTKLV